jgi:MoaA/NifB/PqqE/SkfB family radical SAM enzyme
MTPPTENFCIIPWFGIETTPIGTVRPCCLAREEIIDDNGISFDLHSSTFDQIQNSQYMKDLRQQFLDNKRPPTCGSCWNVEVAGHKSKRLQTLESILARQVSEQTWTTNPIPLKYVDLKLGNICNLKCRICGSFSSSQIASESLASLPSHNVKGFPIIHDKKNMNEYKMLRQGAWPRESAVFWDELEKVLGQIKKFDISGGEPFLIEEHFEMLRNMVVNGHSHDTEIYYNSNGTVYPEQAEDIWKDFQTVKIALSLDDIGARYEYQRSNGNWDVILSNLEKFRQLRARHGNIELEAGCTVSIYNVLYLVEILDCLQTQSLDFVHINFLHYNPMLSIANLPQTIKDQIITHLITANQTANHNEISVVINFMRQGNSKNDILDTLAYMKHIDQLRSTHLWDSSPELAKILNYQYNIQ